MPSLATSTGWLTQADVRRLANGLRVAVVADTRSPVVASVLAYGVGTRDEQAGEEGAAHFLEHMMFKGSTRFGPGEVDRETRALGGANNAYTHHDLTSYNFSFAADRWTRGLDLEADRMAGLRLEPHEVEAERQVILEEIALYEGDPWDVLGEAVQQRLFGSHGYGRPVLGTRQSLAGLDGPKLAAFHRRHYRPDNAVLAIVGDVDIDNAHAAAAERFAGVSRSAEPRPRSTPPGHRLRTVERVVRRRGEVARLLLTLPAPASRDADHPPLRLLATVLGTGRASRLHRRLVDEGQLAVWVSADVHEMEDPGMLSLAAEVLPGVDPEAVETAILNELSTLVAEPPTAAELYRARRILLADWLFGHERVEPRADLLATTLTHHQLDHAGRYLTSLAEADPIRLADVANRWLRVESGAVIGWSLPVPTTTSPDAE